MNFEVMSDRFFNYSATAQMVIDPVTDQTVCANQEMCYLLRRDLTEIGRTPVSRYFASCFAELLVFTQELLENGRGWCDHLSLETRDGRVAVEISGRYIEAVEENYLHLSFLDRGAMQERREKAAAQRHYLSGIGHWNRVSRVFQEFERENQLLLDAAGEGIYGVDDKGVTTFVNPAAERILGYRASELAGRDMHSMVHHSHGDGSDFHVTDCPIYAAFRDGTVHSVEDDIFWTQDGKAIDVEYTSTPIRDNNDIVGAVVVFRDVSQKKADRKKLLAALAEVEQLKNRLEMENAYLQAEIDSEFNHHRILGKSPAVKHLIQQLALVAPTDATVLISGESGTGKELIARSIHEQSQRSGRSLIRVNCAAIPADLFESEFFGHAKGAFTGATSERPGRFELADGGTLFLDEVGEIPLHLQGKLLRVLQEKQLERVGEARTRNVDVRIIAATNRNLREQIENGLFREDLYFRLNVFPVVSVPLRHRLEDIPVLTGFFIEKAGRRVNKPGMRMPLAELEKLGRYHWPGNIRELENLIERQVILARNNTIRIDESLFESAEKPQRFSAPPVSPPVTTDAELRDVQRRSILAALMACQGKVFGADGAAALLGVKPTTLASRIKKYRIDLRDFKGEAKGSL
jgi:PAS domain S-box-containing protein